MATLKDWYAENDSRIQGIAKQNKVDLGVARDMLVSNVKGTGNYAGGGVANMGDLSKGYNAALANEPSQNPGGGASSYYDNYLSELQKSLQSAQRAAEEAQRQRTQMALEANNAYIPQVNQQSDKQLQEAYVSYMKGKRQAPEALSSMGYSGGATESSLLGMDTNYQGIRGDLEESRSQSLEKIRANAGQIEATGNANLSDLAAQYYNQYVAASQQAMEAARNQENMDRTYGLQQKSYEAGTETDMLAKAKLAASYGDYSLLQQLGINPQMEPTGYSGRGGGGVAPGPKAPTGITYEDKDISTKTYGVQLLVNDLVKKHNNGQVSDDDFVNQMNQLGIRTDYSY